MMKTVCSASNAKIMYWSLSMGALHRGDSDQYLRPRALLANTHEGNRLSASG
jgi:hypothetical protein